MSTGSTRWTWRALNSDGVITAGDMIADSEEQVLHRLRQQKLMPLQITPATHGNLFRISLTGLLRRRHDAALRPAELTSFTQQLSTMLGAGLDLDRSLRFLSEIAPGPRVTKVLNRVRDHIRDGGSFADALESEPRSFPRLFIGLVRAGEAGGALQDALHRLADLLEREQKLASTIKSAMIYPAVLLTASVFAVVLLLTRVLPQFVPLFEESGAQLPAITRLVLSAGDFLTSWGYVLLIAILLCFLAGRTALQKPDIRMAADRFLLRLPVLGALIQEIMAARLTRTLGTLLRNGVPLIGALRITEGVITNRPGAACIAAAIHSVREGGSLAATLGQPGIYPVSMTHFLQVGEETAQLAPICLKAADIHEEASRVTIQRLLAILVPAITIAMGLLVAGIVSALLMAMLSLNDLAH